MFNDFEDLLTVEEFADMLSIGKNAAYKLVASGKVLSAEPNSENTEGVCYTIHSRTKSFDIKRKIKYHSITKRGI
ncbi:helix-turn-helix domain-containing protein [Megasphaera sueciensis]|uniref:helix-turn-helix domain-containing protein n=1 Tax=Megasphaera sueciensis TaxID=349094 RepID=UPI003D005B73